jgi:hypothetical protein
MRKFLRENSLSLVLILLFVLTLGAQAVSGWGDYNDDQQSHDQPTVDLATYLGTPHFLEAVFENWESEFLQMGSFVLLTVWLRQKGSPESKKLDEDEEEDRKASKARKDAPLPVRRGGLILKLYEHSLSIAMFSLFGLSFLLHLITGAAEYSDQQLAHGQQAVTAADFLTRPTFWFQSMQNWQSEYMSIALLVVLSVFLREKGSPESKPVDAPHSQTGGD